MSVTVKLFSNLMEYLPQDANGNRVELDGADLTPISILERLKIPQKEAQTLMVNGTFLAEQDHDKALKDGDILTVWPSIQGG